MNDDQNFNFDEMPEPNFDTGWLDSKKLPPQDDKSALPDWLSSAPLLEEEPQTPAAPANATPLPDWLAGQTEQDDYGSTLIEEPKQPAQRDSLSTGSLPDWLSSSDEAAQEPNFDFEEPPLLDNEEPEIEEKPAPSLGLKRLSQTIQPVQSEPPAAPRPVSKPSAPPPPPPPPPQPQIRKLGQKRDSQSFSPDEMTFEEWERQEHQKEYEQTHADDIAMTEAVPDWFVDNVEIGTADKDIASLVLDLEEEEEPYLPEVTAPTTTGSLANYVPDWFMGLEEQNLENAPEWAKAVGTDDLNFDSLVDASAFAPPTPEPEPLPELPTAPTFDDDVPDWFKGVAAPVEDTSGADDWMSALDSALASSAEAQMPMSSQPEQALDFGADTLLDEQPDWFEQQAAEESPEMMQTFIETPSQPEVVDQAADFESSFGEPDWLSDVAPVETTEAESFAPSNDLFGLEMPDTTPEDDFFANMLDAEPDTFAGMVQEGEEEFSWDDASESLFGEGGAANASNLFAQPSATVDADAPDWLREYEAPSDLPVLQVPEEPTVILPRQEAAPEWLDDISGMDFAAEDDLFASASTGRASGFSDKELKDASGTSIDDLLGLSDSQQRNLPMVSGPKSLMVPKSPTDELMGSDIFEGIDDDLLKALDEASPSAPAKTTTSETEAVKETFVADRPEWIADLRPDVPVTLSAGGISIAFEQQRIGDLPDALRRLREKSADVHKVETAGSPQMSVADSGPLAGVTGGLGISPQATAAGELNLVTQLSVSDYQAERIALLEGILELSEQRRRALGLDEDEELEAAATPSKKRKRTRPHFDRFLISIILLAALIGPFLSDSLHLAEDADSSGFTVREYAVPKAVNSLQPGQYVLVAFEYGPTAAGELNPLAEAVLRDILSQGGVPVILSTSSLGAINARGVIENLADDPALLDAVERDEPLRPRHDYFVLRYVSGGLVGIRGLTRNDQVGATIFATDADGEKTGLKFDTLDATDFAFVLVIGGQVEDIRNWAEQFDVPGLPKYALMTAGAEPLATAYVGDAQAGYQGYLAGYRDTYRYNQLRNTRTREAFEVPKDIDVPDPEVSQWHSMALGAMVASGLIGLGVVFNLLRGLRRRRR
ncbi:MAG: hypothetical protein HY862_17905 [Chloroflexi bacterium]|nr:hypothetical protein [Chloroflexota bacterium]